MSVLGTVFYGYFFSFHLLHMANFNQLLLRAIQAVTKNGTIHALPDSESKDKTRTHLILVLVHQLWPFA